MSASTVAIYGDDEQHSQFDDVFSEDSLALELTRKYQDKLRYVAQWGHWLSWDGIVWRPETTLKVYDLARAVCREAANKTEQKAAKGRLLQASTTAAVERMARSDRQFASTVETWDADPWALNTVSGVIDLKTGTIVSREKLHYHTKCAGTKVATEKPELWLNFLDRVTGGDAELQSYLQRMAGYCLTGSTQEHALFFLYGTGANGKSVFTSTLQGIMGDYSRLTPAETFTETKSEQHPCNIASLQSVRLAIAQETEKCSRFAESRLKALTGGDRITARFMRQDFFEFTPAFKVMIAGNHKPRLNSTDEAIRRRFHLLPFSVTIPASERDPRLAEKLKAEHPKILGWAIEGCLQWQQGGLRPPQAVIAATDDYMSNEDRIGLWLAECCVMGRNNMTRSTAAFESYKVFCESLNEQPGSQRSFSQELEVRPGIQKEQDRNGRGFKGFGLKSDLSDHERGSL